MVVSAAMLSRAARALAARATFTPPSRAAAYSPVVRWSAARPGTSNWLTDQTAQGTAARSAVQWLHRVASTGRSVDMQRGHVLVGAGSPNTVVPRLRM